MATNSLLVRVMSMADNYVAIKGQECVTEVTMKCLNMYRGEFTYTGL